MSNSNILELGEILYDAIKWYGEQRILSDIVQGESQEVIKGILERCMSTVESSEPVTLETHGTFAEGLLHYLLTASMIPSQRKTKFQLVDIDIAIPDTRTLGTSPKDVIIISIPKTNNIELINSKISKLRKIQPIPDNIWIVLENDIVPDAKVYTLKDSLTFSNIINDLISFSSDKKHLRLVF